MVDHHRSDLSGRISPTKIGLFIEHLLKEGAALVMFDGLDEVSAEDERRAKIIQTLTRFAKKYAKVQMCVTCRVAAMEYSFTEFTYLEIADFDETQQRLFVEKWYQGEPENLKRFLTGFGKPENIGLQELARTPLLLALLCLAFDETLAFPPRRVDLYKEALDALLKKWDSDRGVRRDEVYRKLSPGRKEHMLARVAAKNFEEGTYFIREEVLVKQITQYLRTLPAVDIDEVPEGDVVLKAIEAQHGVLVARAQGIYSFSHLTFQEYFTARYIVDNHTEEALIRNHLGDTRWREVFLLTASMLDNADGFFDLFLKGLSRWPEENPWLMAWFDWMKVQVDRCKSTYHKAAQLMVLFSIRINRALYRDIDLNLARALDRALNLARALDRALDLARALDRDLENSLISYLDVQLEEENELDALLDKTQVNTLIEYLNALWLLFDCLELAAVTDRDSIKIAAAGGGVI